MSKGKRKSRVWFVAAGGAWLGAASALVFALSGAAFDGLIIAEMFALSVAIVSTMLGFIVRALPPVAAAYFLGYREATEAASNRPGLRAVR